MKTPRPRHILIALSLSFASNRGFLQGVARFLHAHPDWHSTYLDVSELDFCDLSHRLPAGPGRFDAVIAKEDAVPALLAHFGRDQPPFAVFGARQEGDPTGAIAYFRIDDADVGRLAARHFLSLGRYGSYGFFASNRPHSFVIDRQDGYQRELAAQGIRTETCLQWDDTAAIASWLLALPRPTAVFCACDRYALRLLEICRQENIDVPQQMSILGVDNDETLVLFPQPSLTSIQLPHEALGLAAMEAIQRCLKTGRRRIVAPTNGLNDAQIFERDSTKAPPPATHLIRRAETFVRQNLTRAISVEEVARHLGVSRKLLERRFREIGDTTVQELILRQRLDHFCHQLTSSAKPISHIATACGFTNQSWLKTLFKQRYGTTISAWRAAQGLGDAQK